MTGLASEIREILEVAAKDALAAGWAEVREEEAEIGLTLYLEPMKLAAAPLEVYFDSDQLLVCSPGRNDMVCEFFSEDPEEIKRQIRALANAVVEGSYSEQVQEGTTEIVAEWPGPDGREQATRSLLAMKPRGRESWRTVEYEPY
ncbi:MAG: hypothetical protein ACTHNY_08870 [Solirubrobacterales bacterium]